MKHIIARVHGAGQTAVLGVAVALSLAGYWLDELMAHLVGQTRRIREAPAESGMAIVEAVILIAIVVSLIFVIFKFLLPILQGSATQSGNCIKSPQTCPTYAP